MGKLNRLVWIASMILIGLGVISMILNFIPGWSFNISWPTVIIMLGVVFFILVGVFQEKWLWSTLLYLPGAVLIAMGLVFLLNVITNDWSAWAYAWLLVVTALGVGIYLAGRDLGWPRQVKLAAAAMIVGGITLSILFGAIAGGRFILVMAPIMLILGGLALRWLRLETILPERFLKRFQTARSSPTSPAATAPDQSKLVEPLSARELEVLRLVEQGLSNAEIAEKLTLAPSTVKTHINNIYGKLGVQTRVQAIRQSRDLGLLEK